MLELASEHVSDLEMVRDHVYSNARVLILGR